MSRSGTEYGPLTDLPDWSFVGKYSVVLKIILVCACEPTSKIHSNPLNLHTKVASYADLPHPNFILQLWRNTAAR